MATKTAAAKDKKVATVVANDPDDRKGTLKTVGGSVNPITGTTSSPIRPHKRSGSSTPTMRPETASVAPRSPG